MSRAWQERRMTMDNSALLNGIKQLQENISGLNTRVLKVGNSEVCILYIPHICDGVKIRDALITPILQYSKNDPISPKIIMESVIYAEEVKYENQLNKLTDYLLEGNSIIMVSNFPEYLIVNTFKVDRRNIQSPEVESSLRAPRDSFNESLDTNLSLIRYRIKDSTLKIDMCKVGRRTKTSVAVLYLKDVTNNKFVEQVKKTLSEIDVDGILESGYIQKYLSNKNSTLFSQIGISERSDSSCAHILEGKLCILVEGSNIALTLPQNFTDFLDAGDDHYESMYWGIFIKDIRIMSIVISLTLSSMYVTIVAFDPDVLPSQYIFALAASRIAAPVNAVIEAILMEIAVELIREASIRLPRQIGPSVSIVGTIIIGQAAVAAGLVSPLMVIIVSLSSISSFITSDITLMYPIRLLKFLMLILAGIFGLFGFIMGLTIVLVKICSITSFGVPYTAPISPFNFKEIKNFVLSNVILDKERPEHLQTQDKKRQK